VVVETSQWKVVSGRAQPRMVILMVNRSRLASQYRRKKIDIAKYEIEIVQAGRSTKSSELSTLVESLRSQPNLSPYLSMDGRSVVVEIVVPHNTLIVVITPS